MVSMNPQLSILLLTEDSGAQAYHALRVFMAKLLNHIMPGVVTRDDTRFWELASPEARSMMRNNGWKAPTRPDLVRFRQYLATKLRQKYGFVFLHIDGDRIYSERAESENMQKFDSMIRQPVRIILGGAVSRRPGATKSLTETEPNAVGRQLAKLVLIAPFYSIEAWYYQNGSRALGFCPGPPACRRGCAAKLAVWQTDRGLLDEVWKPKNELCFGDRHNAELADAQYPLALVLNAGRSLSDTMKALRVCAELVEALERAKPSWQR